MLIKGEKEDGKRKENIFFWITYTTYAIHYSFSFHYIFNKYLFIYVIYDYFQSYVSQTVYNIIVMLLGVVWSGILAYGAAVFLIKPLRKLEEAARKAAEGDIREDVPLPKTDDEIKSLSVAFNMMLGNLRGMVKILIQHFRIQIIKYSRLENKQAKQRDKRKVYLRHLQRFLQVLSNQRHQFKQLFLLLIQRLLLQVK